MKKLIALAAALSMLFCFAACGEKAGEPAPAPTEAPAAPVPPATEAPAATPAPTIAPTAEPTAEPTPTPAPTPSQEQYQHYYYDILKQYATALAEGLDVQGYFDRGLNYLVGMVNDSSKIGYCFRDCSGDNIPELLIGVVGEKEIYAMYTLDGANPKQIIDAGERSVFHLEPDNAIVNRGSSGAAHSAYMIYTVGRSGLELVVGLIADYSVNEAEPWYRTYDEDFDLGNDEKISNDFAETAIKAYEDNYVAIDYKAIDQFEG